MTDSPARDAEHEAEQDADVSGFDRLGLDAKLLRALDDLGFDQPTPIQREAIPLALQGRDVMGLAQTGTGKTAAFGLPLAQRLMGWRGKPDPFTAKALVLAPTRELANQIADSVSTFTAGTPLRTAVVVGGASIRGQIQRMRRGVDILVATPGRLLDLVERDALDLSATGFLVLDEADQMLDLGFIHALRRIASLLSDDRQTMLFSATMPKPIEELSRAFLHNPVRVEVSPPGKAADKIEQSVHFVTDRTEKTALLRALLSDAPDELSLVFARTKHGAERLMKALVKAGLNAASIHGDKSQGQRERAIAGFRAGEIRILVATDVAARGIDIPGVAFVYNFDLPHVPDAYVHRIGRTARAGAEGEAIAFCAPDEIKLLRAIERLMKISIPVAGGQAPPEPKRETPSRNKPRARRGGPSQPRPAGPRRRRPRAAANA